MVTRSTAFFTPRLESFRQTYCGIILPPPWTTPLQHLQCMPHQRHWQIHFSTASVSYAAPAPSMYAAPACLSCASPASAVYAAPSPVVKSVFQVQRYVLLRQLLVSMPHQRQSLNTSLQRKRQVTSRQRRQWWPHRLQDRVHRSSATGELRCASGYSACRTSSNTGTHRSSASGELRSPALTVHAAVAPVVKYITRKARITIPSAVRSASAPRGGHDDCNRHRFELKWHSKWAPATSGQLCRAHGVWETRGLRTRAAERIDSEGNEHASGRRSSCLTTAAY